MERIWSQELERETEGRPVPKEIRDFFIPPFLYYINIGVINFIGSDDSLFLMNGDLDPLPAVKDVNFELHFWALWSFLVVDLNVFSASGLFRLRVGRNFWS